MPSDPLRDLELLIRSRHGLIHLDNQGKSAEEFDLVALGAASSGFSGSDVEEVVVSVTMAEKVESLRAWARDRAVRANRP